MVSVILSTISLEIAFAKGELLSQEPNIVLAIAGPRITSSVPDTDIVFSEIVSFKGYEG